ncbi:hypothetical protein BDA96_01G494700 [Sorghum bicolor]|uniref:Uncharacterized protein n=2 Tax=Sorghum bicolor TaxID=4558 RepID=A0A921S870_SORBI|nr:hypothetical protein BDA96_01G494700 [Sorghum bicolor]KXG39913.1 hypothetical protein SORBI_3001G463700 [Sorghum bicolor]
MDDPPELLHTLNKSFGVHIIYIITYKNDMNKTLEKDDLQQDYLELKHMTSFNYGFVYSIFFSFLHTNGKTAIDWTQKANIGKLAFLIR